MALMYNRHIAKKPVNVKALNWPGIFHFSFFNYRRHTLNGNQVDKIFGKGKSLDSTSCLQSQTFAVKEHINLKTQFAYKNFGAVEYRSIIDGKSVAFPSFR